MLPWEPAGVDRGFGTGYVSAMYAISSLILPSATAARHISAMLAFVPRCCVASNCSVTSDSLTAALAASARKFGSTSVGCMPLHRARTPCRS